ncbi:MAG TPA: alpha-amylase family glycosyl hydrolase [Bryobacteraceae bacterium]|nr:alpha-amylase family glycosyl hydrolase [Bryobacteraceae bacterium]
MINLAEVGAAASVDAAGQLHVRFGIYLPGIRAADGFEVVVRLIHSEDRFDPNIPPQNFNLDWDNGHPLDLWSKDVTVLPVAGTHFGQEGTYLYRFQLWWTPAGANRQLISLWVTDPFASATDVGRLSAVTLTRNPAPFTWTDAAYKTPELDDLVVYELQVEEFNDTFDGVIDRLTYLDSLGVNCLELMPVTSAKLDFDWGYGPLHYFAPSARFGGPDGLRRLVDAAHARNIAVILDVVYEHVDYMFPYFRVYDDLANTVGTPKPLSPMIRGLNVWGFGPATDFTQTFTQEYFQTANRMWLDEYHADGFRYDEVSDLYVPPRDAGYAQLVEQTYRYSLTIGRFQRPAGGYSRIIQCAEALGKARDVLSRTFTNCAWQDDLLNKSEDMVTWHYADANFAHLLDPYFSGYPATKAVVDSGGNAVDMPVAPFQYEETHDHSQLIVFAGTESDPGPLAEGDRSRYYRLQPYAIALLTAQGIPMLWQGQEFADNFPLPGNGLARVHLRRDVHWEYFYDEYGIPLVRVHRRLGQLRRSSRALRSHESYFYYLQSLQGTQIIAYHRHAPAAGGAAEQYAMVLVNFGDSAGTISVPFPKAGTWTEMLDADVRNMTISVAAAGAVQTITVPSNYGMIFAL